MNVTLPQDASTILENARTSLRLISEHFCEDNKRQMIMLQWKFIAIVVDRVCLIVFLILTLSGALFLFIEAQLSYRQYIPQDH